MKEKEEVSGHPGTLNADTDAPSGAVAPRVTKAEPTQPRRVQLSRAKGWRMPPNTVKVDRSSGFGNPFPTTKCKSTTQGVTTDTWCIGTWEGPAMWFRDTKPEATELAVRAFRAWAYTEGYHQAARRQLAGKNLACWCALDAPCHADVLLEIANAETPTPVRSTGNGTVERTGGQLGPRERP